MYSIYKIEGYTVERQSRKYKAYFLQVCRVSQLTRPSLLVHGVKIVPKSHFKWFHEILQTYSYDIPSVNQKHVAKILFVERYKLNMRLTKDIVPSYIGQIPKGQIISKRLLVSSDSSKKQTNKFVFFCLTVLKTNLIVHFLEVVDWNTAKLY